MRIFPDTNFLVSAFATRGLSNEVFTLIAAEHDLVVGEIVIDEFKKVLENKFTLPKPYIAEAEELLRRFEVFPIPEQKSKIVLRDENDRWGLSSAIEGKADVLVTGDKDLLDESVNITTIKILTPRDFWDLLRST